MASTATGAGEGGAPQLPVIEVGQNQNEIPPVVSDAEKKEEGRPLTPGSSANVSLNGAVGGPEYTNEAPSINTMETPFQRYTPALASDSDNGSSALPAPPPYEKLAQKNPKPTDHLSITIGPAVILLSDIVFPCIIYYVWFDIHRARWAKSCEAYPKNECPLEKPEYDKDILGYAIICFGFGELYILIVRVLRLLKHRDLCAPLLSRSKWELDATSWVYGVSMLMALIPFVVGSELEIPELYLYSPGFLMSFLGIVMVISLIPFKIPIGINSHARGSPMRPFIYYAAEDFIAVDGLQDREFRVRYNARYDSSPGFRRMFLHLTLWWIFGVMVYLGCLSAVIWSLEFHYAFGLSLGVLFAYLAIWATSSYFWVDRVMKKERRAYEERVAKF
ncbi:uncharacterized protein EAF02_011454 [Botrytis sinoallii]|uniref:uncharacterized protein n=1 Tax=Botrytis sinoallii TaxID=1463999 RepID=UPI001900E20E|nr:uncharacterized protein EAF02_011454 [Botrytis sinoallii]KAF7856195.1 hypothetical protein EAF02_011454 [Botrytis sinoallii]